MRTRPGNGGVGSGSTVVNVGFGVVAIGGGGGDEGGGAGGLGGGGGGGGGGAIGFGVVDMKTGPKVDAGDGVEVGDGRNL